MRRPRLLELFPKLGPIISVFLNRLLHFTDYKYQKSLISRLDCVQEFQIAYSIDKVRIQSYMKAVADILFINTSYDPESLALIGSNSDGSYVTSKESSMGKKWISIGIGSHFEFEQALSSLGNHVNGYDLQIGKFPKKSQEFRITRTNWGTINSKTLKTLKMMIEESGIDVNEKWNLKFDIEGAEWDLLDQIYLLENPPVIIACELHNLVPRFNDQTLDLKIKNLTELDARYEAIFVKPNNYSAYILSEGIGFYDVVEVTWILRSERLPMQKTKSIENSDLVVVNDKLKPLFPVGYLYIS